jgi:FAD/FMN-containing dehydrogenase/Fe-S oxidoreductase
VTGDAVGARTSSAAAALIDELAGRERIDARGDRLSRALFATDASIYEIIPDGVVYPRRVEDIQRTVRACARHGVPLTARGAGTGLAGGCVNRGIILDCSRCMNRIASIDPQSRTAVVEPGVVLDDLNAEAASYGLQFAPDVATSSRATIGGMIANNSCGAHSVMYGRTVDHVIALDVVLADGSRHTWGQMTNDELRITKSGAAGTSLVIRNSSFVIQCEDTLRQAMRNEADEIASRFPKVMRRNGGYALDRLREDNGRINIETIICGSEGTLAVVVGAVLKLVPLPQHKGLVVAHFADLLESLAATPAALAHTPAAVELLDKTILDAARHHPAQMRRPWLVEGDPRGLLIIELYDDDMDSLTRRLSAVAADLKSRGMGYAWPILVDSVQHASLWEIRKSGLGLLMSRPGQRHAYDFVEDTAVDPARLRDYIARFIQVLKEEGVEEASYYAHASVGCLHVKPVLNLRQSGDVQKMHRIADRISSLALEFGGTMTGEHGDGILRSCWLEKMYGRRIVEAFRKIKTAFDPQGILNPGKIVDPLPMLENLRFAMQECRAYSDPHPGPLPERERETGATALDFSLYGGMSGLAEMCSGVGQCRQKLVGTMCPSYMATGDEQHTTRGRANALRLALSDRGLIDGLADPVLDEVMDLCLSCKACRTECPTGVDMAKLKAEWQSQRNRRRGTPLRSRLVAATPALAAWGCRTAPLSNWLAQSKPARWLMDAFFGFDRRIAPPKFSQRTFRHWFQSAVPASAGKLHPKSAISKPKVVYFVDTWTNYFTSEVGIAAVRILESLGYEVIVPPTVCCGRPAISKGMLDEAKRLAERNAAVLAPYADAGVPIVGTEPSCILTFADEFPQLVRTDDARRIAEQAVMMETFLATHANQLRIADRGLRIEEGPASADRKSAIRNPQSEILYHAHCHQKALVGTGDAMKLLRAAFGDAAQEIGSGCCGMAGSFGHEREHYDVARAIGEERLFPAVRGRGDAAIAVSGFSCRHQIAHHTGAEARHLVEYLAEAFEASAPRTVVGPV